jgi:hypothetical protein
VADVLNRAAVIRELGLVKSSKRFTRYENAEVRIIRQCRFGEIWWIQWKARGGESGYQTFGECLSRLWDEHMAKARARG